MPESDIPTKDAFDERLSAAIDNEATPAEFDTLFEEILSDPEKQEAWEQHHLVNAVLSQSIAPEPRLRDAVDWDRALSDLIEKEQAKSHGIDWRAIWLQVQDSFSWIWVGGAAFAMSVLLAASLFLTVQPDLTGGMSGQLADESTSSTPSNSQSDLPLLADTAEGSLTEEMRVESTDRNSQQPEPVLVGTKAQPASSQGVDNRSRSMPPQVKPPNRDLVRLVSD